MKLFDFTIKYNRFSIRLVTIIMGCVIIINSQSSCSSGIEIGHTDFFGCDTIEKEYYESGNLRTVKPLKNCTLDGYLVNYYESGIVESKLYFRDGVQVDTTFSYFPDGFTRAFTIMKFGIPHGPAVRFYDSADTMSIGQFVNGFKTGIWFEFDTLGVKHFVDLDTINIDNGPDVDVLIREMEKGQLHRN